MQRLRRKGCCRFTHGDLGGAGTRPERGRELDMADHDQRLKVLLRELFEEFFRLFYPAWAERFDFTQVEWLDKEVFTDPPQGERRYLDLLARLPVRQPVVLPGAPVAEHWIILVHLEVES